MTDESVTAARFTAFLLLLAGCGGGDGTSTTAQQRPTIPGLTATDVTVNLEERGFECDGPDDGPVYMTWTCRLGHELGEYMVTTYGHSSTELVLIEADAVTYAGNPTALARPVLGFVATLPYEGSFPQAARRWVEQRLGKKGRRYFGSVLYEVSGNERSRFLEMKIPGV